MLFELIKEIIEDRLNLPVTILHKEFRKGDVKRNYSDISKARKILGFNPKIDLEEGLRYTLDWFIKENK